jgi:putative copper resistance protein D
VAPDFSFAVGPAPARSLKELRGGTSVLLVLFSLPDSRARLVQLAEIGPELAVLGLEVIAVPTDADPHILARLAGDTPILFPVVTEGAHPIVSTYALFGRTAAPERATAELPMPHHVEFLIDRQGYMRARWIPDAGSGAGWTDLAALRAALATLGREAPAASPDEHVH